MPGKPRSDFNHLVHQLSTHLVYSASVYMQERDLGYFSKSRFESQTATDIDQLATEMLTFGGDLWPLDAVPSAAIVDFPKSSPQRSFWQRVVLPHLFAYGSAVLAVAMAIAVDLIINNVFGVRPIGVLFVCAISGIGAIFGTRPALFTVALSTFGLFFCFMDPIYTFDLTDPLDLVRLGCFAVFSVLVVLVQTWAHARCPVTCPVDDKVHHLPQRAA